MDDSELKTTSKPYDVFTVQNEDGHKDTVEEEERLKLQWKDILAIIIAIYRVFLPWAFGIAGIYFFLFLLYDWIF